MLKWKNHASINNSCKELKRRNSAVYGSVTIEQTPKFKSVENDLCLMIIDVERELCSKNEVVTPFFDKTVE